MQIDEIVWQQQFVEKLAIKHGVEKTEVEEILSNRPRFRFVSKGDRPGEDVTQLWDKRTRDAISLFFLFKNQIVGH